VKLALATLVWLVLLAGPALAQDEVQSRRFTIAERGSSLVVSVNFADVFDTSLLANLDSGFATTLVLRAYVFPDRQGALPVSLALATVRIVYDLWDGQYLVQIDDGRGRSQYLEPTLADALRRATTLRDFPVAPLVAVPVGEVHFVGVIVEANPVSRELLAEVRRWLAREADRPRATSDSSSSIVGSFISVFVNPRIPVADRVLKLRSQRFYRTGPVVTP
jgi:hypothetical protein